MRAIDAALLLVARLLGAVAAAATAAVFVIVLSAVVLRYAIAAPMQGGDELAGLLLCMASVLVIPLTLAKNQNIRVTLITERLSGLPERLFWIAGQFIVVAFFGLVAWDAFKIASFTQMLNLRTEQARFPLSPWLWAFVAAFAISAAVAAWQVIRPIPRGEKTIL